MSAKIRLYVEQDLAPGQSVPLSRDQAHYLFGVMRLGVGAQVLLFNGRDGEFLADVAEAGKRGGVLMCVSLTRDLQMPPDLWLLFAPIKKARTDFIVEKAAEMGASRIVPVMTEFTNAGRVHRDRLQAHAVEAAEQCGGTFVPEVAEAVKLDRLLADWDRSRMIMFCDETGAGSPDPGLDQFRKCGPRQSWAILVGPEGGFSERERTLISNQDGTVYNAGLGPRILRADTAAVAAMALWQRALGDWQWFDE
ncbi:16S rRNA (uracil(1498)-N(3))-methyltransferase [uncultured Sulfitobacter sp.]|uniref:16S rRNA (uracil(1498)-N(3))-methyltransferase n=1 Tax=uncultured Sulfitobacter sp. TaxID=191468 RepID=UPI0026269787|nr:16S rRNA (uracil(1498)-N(3))-methyltransferase [uncultured Sulfitobacter sp.]